VIIIKPQQSRTVEIIKAQTNSSKQQNQKRKTKRTKSKSKKTTGKIKTNGSKSNTQTHLIKLKQKSTPKLWKNMM
jgi:hypothetical protein